MRRWMGLLTMALILGSLNAALPAALPACGEC